MLFESLGAAVLNIVSPSILSADFANLAYELERVRAAQWLHIDVMDGHFVPNITVGMPVVSCIRRVTDHYLDVHLMICDPLRYGPQFAKAGANMVCFHIEADGDPAGVIRALHDAGAHAGVALKPGTPAEAVYPFLKEADMVLLMTVEPGFGGQVFLPEVLPKIRAVRGEADRRGLELKIQVDGGINLETARLCAEAGADVLVAGSYVFGGADPAKAVYELASI